MLKKTIATIQCAAVGLAAGELLLLADLVSVSDSPYSIYAPVAWHGLTFAVLAWSAATLTALLIKETQA